MAHDVTVDKSVPTHKKSREIKKRSRRKDVPIEWFSGPYDAVKGESSLWVAVITQAMMDALGQCKNSEAQYYKHESIRWLTGNSHDFTMVCLLAGLDPDYVRRKAKQTLIAPKPWRAEAGKGKRYHERKAYRKRVEEQSVEEPSMVITGAWATA